MFQVCTEWGYFMVRFDGLLRRCWHVHKCIQTAPPEGQPRIISRRIDLAYESKLCKQVRFRGDFDNKSAHLHSSARRSFPARTSLSRRCLTSPRSTLLATLTSRQTVWPLSTEKVRSGSDSILFRIILTTLQSTLGGRPRRTVSTPATGRTLFCSRTRSYPVRNERHRPSTSSK